MTAEYCLFTHNSYDESVVTDMEGIEWIGQGFADQFFRVFASQNPSIELRVINANEDILRMLRYVREL